ncbi:MAG TPA: tetratricopeptide repeat protein [Phycisphaerae bacterium]|nr:tetratricopeptide repeat protein [Phycisphaerae bacterium]
MAPRTCVVGVALAAALLAGCESDSARLNRMGLEAYYQGEYRQALAAFEEAVAANPDMGTYYFNCGMAEQALGDLDRALFLYRIATKLNPSAVEAYRHMATCHLAKGEPQKALGVLETGTKANPYTGDAFVNVARYYLDRKDPSVSRDEAMKQARLWLAKAVAADPDSARAHREFGLFLVRLGEREKGIEHLRRSMELAPVQPELSARLSEMEPSGPEKSGLPPPQMETE